MKHLGELPFSKRKQQFKDYQNSIRLMMVFDGVYTDHCSILPKEMKEEHIMKLYEDYAKATIKLLKDNGFAI